MATYTFRNSLEADLFMLALHQHGATYAYWSTARDLHTVTIISTKE